LITILILIVILSLSLSISVIGINFIGISTLSMSQVIRSLSGLQSCPVCESHHHSGELARHIREQHRNHPFDAAQIQILENLGLKSCPTCQLYYCSNKNTFNRHVNQCRLSVQNRKRRADSPKSNNTTIKRTKQQSPPSTDTTGPTISTSDQDSKEDNSSSLTPPISPSSSVDTVYSSPATPIIHPLPCHPEHSYYNHPERHLTLEALHELKEREAELKENEEVKQNEHQSSNIQIVAAPIERIVQSSSSAPQTDYIHNITPADIANHPKLLRKIPYVNRAMFRTVVRRILLEYVQASIIIRF
jgi:hypothetical protein